MTAPAASAQSSTSTPSYGGPVRAAADRPNMVSVGVIVWLASELMFFAALFAMYFSIRAVHPELWAESTKELNLPFASLNTLILVLSSVTCQMGVFAAEKGNVVGLRRWFIITFIMGAYFIGGQIAEYTELVHHGITLSSTAYGSVFYLTTGFHGLHVTGGLFAFLVVLGRTYAARRFTNRQATTAIVVSYYWHFVDVVWIGLFFAIYGLR